MDINTLPHIHLIIGPMFSGKSNELIKQVNRYSAIGKNCLVLNHELDNRVEGDVISTHDGKNIKSKLNNSLDNINTEHYDVIAVDEGQFFENLHLMACKWADLDKKIVIIAGLQSDSNRVGWENITDIIPYADIITHLKSFCMICKDGSLAIYSHLKQQKDKQKTHDGRNILEIGGEDKYQPLCRKCFNLKLIQQNNQ